MDSTTKTTQQGGGKGQRAIGCYDPTAQAAFTITDIGFKPRYVKVINIDDNAMVEWFYGMDAASAIKISTAGARSVISSNGITVQENGFKVGADTDIVQSGEQLVFIALG